jgi:hypothetical protein
MAAFLCMCLLFFVVLFFCCCIFLVISEEFSMGARVAGVVVRCFVFCVCFVFCGKYI